MVNELLKIKRRIFFLLPQSFRKKLPREIAIVCINNNESKRLNYLFRGVRKETNVLSFRYDKDYGELLLCPEVIKKEAQKKDNSYQYQMTWMILHGMIHLGGAHHEDNQAKEKMVENLEKKIMEKLFFQTLATSG